MLHCELAVHFQLVLLCWNCQVVGWRPALLSMLSFFKLVLVAATAVSRLLLPFRWLHITLFRTRNCSKPRFIHQWQAFACSSPMIHIWDSHENKHKDIMKIWKRHVQCKPYTESQIRAQPSPAHQSQTPTPEPNPTPNPVPARPHQSPNPSPNPAQRATAGPNPAPQPSTAVPTKRVQSSIFLR